MLLADKNWIDHPGSFIREELEARSWSQIDLAYILGCPVQSINLMVNEKRGISPEMAKALGKAFSVSPEFLINLQKLYELSQAEEPGEDIEKRAKIRGFPISKMTKRGWIEEANDSNLMEEQLKRFFEIDSLEDQPRFAHAAKKTSYDQISYEQLAWLYRAKQVASEMVIGSFTVAKARALVDKLAQLRNEPEQTRHVPKLLNESGIRFVLVEALPGSEIDGACFWLDKQSPVIGMTLRFHRIDNFWFVLRHEIEHVIRMHGQDMPIIDVGLHGENAGTGKDIPEEERVANEAAANFCVEQKKMNNFYLRKAPYISEKDVLALASITGIHPGLVVGQIHNRTGVYAFLRKYLVSIKEHVMSGAVTDGWGEIAPVEL